jgi:hypothetical protein
VRRYRETPSSSHEAMTVAAERDVRLARQMTKRRISVSTLSLLNGSLAMSLANGFNNVIRRTEPRPSTW